jgi:hypothetical protein
VCGEWNWGTWSAPNQGPFAIRDFLDADTRWVVQAGQSGTPGPPQPPDADQDGWTSDYASCRRVLPILEAEHWSAMDAGPAHAWFGAAGGQWQQEGCLDAITTRLGYRFRLTSATLPEHVQQGAPMPLELQLYNDGFAAPYNARAFELVFRNRRSGALTRVPLAADPRRWQPGPVALSLAPTVPRQLAQDEYDVLIAFPDPSPSLHDRPEFAIRLANDGVWDATCGCNSLHASLRVLPGR